MNGGDSADAASLEGFGPVVKHGSGLLSGGAGEARVAGGGVAGADDPQIIALEGEIGFEAVIGAQEIQSSGGGEELHVAGRDHWLVGNAGKQLAAAFEVDDPGCQHCAGGC